MSCHMMDSARILLVLATLVAGFCLVHLEVSPQPASIGVGNNGTITITALTNSSSNTLVNISSNSISNKTIITSQLVGPANETSSAQNGTTTTTTTTSTTAAPTNQPAKSDEEVEFDRYKNSIYYLPAYEQGLKSIPKAHKDYIDGVADRDMSLFLEILDEAIEKRNRFAASVGLMWKYATKLVTTCIKNRQGELRITPRKEMQPAFYNMVADLMEEVLKKSKEVRRDKGYTKSSIDVSKFGERVRKAFNYVVQTIHSSPLAVYVKWDQLVLYKNESTPVPVVEEASDLVAMFSAMGYDNCLFVARRIVNLLRFFSKGKLPSETEV